MPDIVTDLQQLDRILRREEAQCDALAHNIQRERHALRALTLTDMASIISEPACWTIFSCSKRSERRGSRGLPISGISLRQLYR